MLCCFVDFRVVRWLGSPRGCDKSMVLRITGGLLRAARRRPRLSSCSTVSLPAARRLIVDTPVSQQQFATKAAAKAPKRAVKSKATATKSKGGVASGKAITKEVYTKKTPIEHVLLRPDLYVGPTELVLNKLWVPESAGTVREQEVRQCPGFAAVLAHCQTIVRHLPLPTTHPSRGYCALVSHVALVQLATNWLLSVAGCR